jgi:hypothetical protein
MISATHTERRLRIVRRAYSQYTDFCSYIGSYLGALAEADHFERMNCDGEYLVRRFDEPNWLPGSS